MRKVVGQRFGVQRIDRRFVSGVRLERLLHVEDVVRPVDAITAQHVVGAVYMTDLLLKEDKDHAFEYAVSARAVLRAIVHLVLRGVRRNPFRICIADAVGQPFRNCPVGNFHNLELFAGIAPGQDHMLMIGSVKPFDGLVLVIDDRIRVKLFIDIQMVVPTDDFIICVYQIVLVLESFDEEVSAES